MLNINGLVIICIILNDQIKKRIIRVISCYPISNWVVFEFVIFLLDYYSCCVRVSKYIGIHVY